MEGAMQISTYDSDLQQGRNPGFNVIVLLLGLILAWSWGGVPSAEAIEMGSLQGAVRDESGKPVTGAAVKIRHLERGITVTVFSHGGNYNVPGLYPGRSEVSAGLGGHEDSTKAEVEIAAGKGTSLNLTLAKPSSPILTPADWIPQLPDDRDGTKQLVINRCVNCHGPVNIVANRFDRLGWKKVILDMGRVEETGRPNYKEISDERAMAATDEETERLAAYYSKYFGPDKAPGVNFPKAVAYRNTHSDADVIITQFDIPTRTAVPHNLTVDPQGHIWFVERFADKIGGLNPNTGEFREFPIPAKARPHGALADKSGFIWWTESRGNHLGRLDSRTGQMKRYPLPHEGSSPHSLSLGKDGLIWMTQIRGGRIASFNPQTESFKEYIIPTKSSRPYGIVVDSRNHVWFCEFSGDKIGMLDPATGVIKEYAPPTRYSGPRRLTLDRNDNVWFTEYNTNQIALLNPDTGKIQEWEIPTPDSGPYDIVVDHHGKIWFDEFTANKIVRFDPVTAKFTEYPLPGLDSQVRKMTVDQAGAVWLSEYKNSRMVRVVER